VSHGSLTFFILFGRSSLILLIIFDSIFFGVCLRNDHVEYLFKLCSPPVADPEILKTGGGGVGVSASSLFIACAQNAFLSGKRRLAEKNARANGRRRASPIAPL